ncbi:MAG: hypothetical protein JSW27_16115 [Phycisphaerales bacterium]|nr:MAG: hypothetical protein JSW27_16115 [Phycisphaerales bacterium]
MGRKRTVVLTVVFVLAAVSTAVSAKETIPFVEALNDALISVDRLDDILEYALLIGNGDINALVYTDSGNVELVLTKNDVWDARLDTALDPPLPTLKRIKELNRGTWANRGVILPEGSTWEGPDSYHAHPYPCPRACARLILGTRPTLPRWRNIRSQGTRNQWEARKSGAAMIIAGNAGASNGWRCAPFEFSTDDYHTMRLTVSGSKNAQYYVDVMDAAGSVVFATKWQTSPVETQTRLFRLPAGKAVGSVILYTMTLDGKRAENRFEKMHFDGREGTLPVNLHVPSLPTTRARLDLGRAMAQIDGASGGPPRAVIRALAQRNTFLIEADVAARLEQFHTTDTPDAVSGQAHGIRWLHQTIPGDLDWPGMEFAVALADVGERKAVTIVTSLESDDVVAAAVTEARAVAQANATWLIRDHEAVWSEFWSASGLEVDDELMEQTWYRGLYFLRCVSKPGVVAPGLFASLTTGSPAWHGDYHTNYNIQQTFWHCYAANHPELAEPYDRLIRSYFPRARWLARTIFDMGGAFYPHVLFAYEPPDPSKVKSPVGRQYIHHVWGLTLGVSGFTVQPLWWHYKYEPDRYFLEHTAYPAVRDVAVFYADFIDQCAHQDGRAVLAPSVSPEHWGWTGDFERNRNCTFDIAMARYMFNVAIEGAMTLQRDAELVTRFRRALTLLPDYPSVQAEPPVVVDVEGAPPINYNIVVPTTPVFPGDVVTWQSPAGQRELFRHTIESIQWNGNNSMVMLGVARARLDVPGTLDWMREEVRARLRPNGTLTLNRLGHHFNSFGHYTEQFAASMVLSELLIQSVNDVIRVFPAWTGPGDARFRRLRTQGGFLVSSSFVDGKIDSVEVESTAGGPLRLVSPWPKIAVRSPAEMPSRPLAPDAWGAVEVSTRPGDRLIFKPDLKTR